jgi:hypothetical protein
MVVKKLPVVGSPPAGRDFVPAPYWGRGTQTPFSGATASEWGLGPPAPVECRGKASARRRQA